MTGTRVRTPVKDSGFRGQGCSRAIGLAVAYFECHPHMNLPLLPLRSRRTINRGIAAFSLVEVTLALGIMSFALVGLMGLLPLGLSTSRKSVVTATGAQIAQRLIDEAEQTDFNQLIATAQTIRYFDDQGNELASNTGAMYNTNLVVVATTTLPGATAANPNLATIFLQVANNPGNQAIASGTNYHWTAVSGVTITSYAANVARNE